VRPVTCLWWLGAVSAARLAASSRAASCALPNGVRGSVVKNGVVESVAGRTYVARVARFEERLAVVKGCGSTSLCCGGFELACRRNACWDRCFGGRSGAELSEKPSVKRGCEAGIGCEARIDVSRRDAGQKLVRRGVVKVVVVELALREREM
jgi:hypothetical protein